mgnify:CR=1 FL=1
MIAAAGTSKGRTSKTCHNCTLINPITAVRCDCGFEFSASSGTITRAIADSHRKAFVRACGGLVVGIVAVGISVFSYISADPGESFTIMGGLAAAGIIFAGRAITRMRDLRTVKSEWEQAGS